MIHIGYQHDKLYMLCRHEIYYEIQTTMTVFAICDSIAAFTNYMCQLNFLVFKKIIQMSPGMRYVHTLEAYQVFTIRKCSSML